MRMTSGRIMEILLFFLHKFKNKFGEFIFMTHFVIKVDIFLIINFFLQDI